MMGNRKIRIGIVDDHTLFAKSLETMFAASKTGIEVAFNVRSGKECLEWLAKTNLEGLPDVLLLDVNMPDMNGIETARRVHDKAPFLKMCALSMNNSDASVIDMIRSGCCAYLLKETEPEELVNAIHEIVKKGYYNGDVASVNFQKVLRTGLETIQLNDKEKVFLQYACSDLTYTEIAEKMNLSARTIEGYREMLFTKLNVQSRVGLAMEAIRMGIVKL